MKKKQYLLIDMLVFKPEGWSKRELDDFNDELMELIENYKGQGGGSLSTHTEEQVDAMYDG